MQFPWLLLMHGAQVVLISSESFMSLKGFALKGFALKGFMSLLLKVAGASGARTLCGVTGFCATATAPVDRLVLLHFILLLVLVGIGAVLCSIVHRPVRCARWLFVRGFWGCRVWRFLVPGHWCTSVCL